MIHTGSLCAHVSYVFPLLTMDCIPSHPRHRVLQLLRTHLSASFTYYRTVSRGGCRIHARPIGCLPEILQIGAGEEKPPFPFTQRPEVKTPG